MRAALGAIALALAVAQPAPLGERMLLAEDARAQAPADLAPLKEGLNSRDPKLRRQAVRAIGRLERADLIPLLTRALADNDADVRMEAANAVGQLARGEKGVADAKSRLVVRSRLEQDPRVWSVVGATLGRLAYTAAPDVEQVEDILAKVLPHAGTRAIQIDAVLGAVEGLEALARQSGKISRLKETTLNGLRAAAELEGRAQDAEKLARIRRLATQALIASGGVTKPQLEAGLADADDEVRRLTMVAARGDVEGRETVIERGLADASARVRYEALQSYGRVGLKASCEPVIRAAGDPNAHVSLLAIDLLGTGCAGHPPAAALLETLAARTPANSAWHAAAHALVALARIAPVEARPLLPGYAAHATWQVRMYAARAAGALGEVALLVRLGRDNHDNVREAALGELVAAKRPEAIEVALDALARSDYQLILTAARALDAAAAGEPVAPLLLQTLGRLTGQRRDTSRDPRLAILDRLEDGVAPDGTATKAGASLQPYLTDFDPVIAGRAAELLKRWHIPGAVAAPRPLPRPAVSQAAVDALRQARLRFVMAGRGTFELRLLVDEAPLSALRVATRAREGYYNGLTFHRVVPNFVVQGGSPGANEYMGDGPYMRDEVGLVSHRRGAVGISTRGRDTGDAQIFIDLVDLPRLDHTYTVFAEVVSGMDVVDALLEGDVMERVELVTPSS